MSQIKYKYMNGKAMDLNSVITVFISPNNKTLSSVIYVLEQSMYLIISGLILPSKCTG